MSMSFKDEHNSNYRDNNGIWKGTTKYLDEIFSALYFAVVLHTPFFIKCNDYEMFISILFPHRHPGYRYRVFYYYYDCIRVRIWFCSILHTVSRECDNIYKHHWEKYNTQVIRGSVLWSIGRHIHRFTTWR